MYTPQVIAVTLALLSVSANAFVIPPSLSHSALHLRARAARPVVRMAAEESRADAMRRAEIEADKLTAKAQVGTTGGAVSENKVVREAPIIKERIHEKTTEVDKTRIEEERIKLEVQQKIQPITDERRVEQDLKKVDHGLEVNEHGRAGLDKDALAELERRRQEVASKAGTTRDSETERISERPDVVKKSKTNVVEQVVPVVERDVYIPHRVEHEKEIKEVIFEKPVVKETVVEPTISKAEFEKQYGTVKETSVTELKTAEGTTRTRESSSSTTRK